jgi:hypothetical protein
MEDQESLIKGLSQKLESFVILSADLYRLKIVYKSADVLSALAARLIVLMFFVIFTVIVNIALALLIGKHLGEYYYGFFVVAAFYGLVGLVLYAFRNAWIKAPIKKMIITDALD